MYKTAAHTHTHSLSLSLLTDPRYFQFEQFWGLQSFIVYVDEEVFQIDPVAFILNQSMIIAYEIMDLKTGKPLDKDDISSKVRNWNLRRVKGYNHLFDVLASTNFYTIKGAEQLL